MPLTHKSCASRVRACIVAVALFGSFTAAAQTCPLKPIRVVVPNPAGGFRVIAGSPEELSARIKADSELTAGLVKAVGLKPE